MSRKIIAIFLVLLSLVVLSGCVVTPSGGLNYRGGVGYGGVNYGHPPVGVNYGVQGTHPQYHYDRKYYTPGVYYRQRPSNMDWNPRTGNNWHRQRPMPHYAPVGRD
ncbi:MAG: hypothetical protein KBC78_03535 [Candidatus Pacebacteria bacterium]|nr:hypothetical protein [Candidatus Paceibacterota bacterium]